MPLGEVVQTYKRVARVEDVIYIDLGGGQAVAIDSRVGAVVDNPPVVFQAKKDMGILPRPERGGSLDELRGICQCWR